MIRRHRGWPGLHAAGRRDDGTGVRRRRASTSDRLAERLNPIQLDQVLARSGARRNRKLDFVGDPPIQHRGEAPRRRSIQVGLFDPVDHGLGQIRKPDEVPAVLTLLESTRKRKRVSRHACPRLLPGTVYTTADSTSSPTIRCPRRAGVTATSQARCPGRWRAPRRARPLPRRRRSDARQYRARRAPGGARAPAPGRRRR